MKEIRKTSQFKKDYKRFKNDKEFVETLMGIVKLLAEGNQIPEEYNRKQSLRAVLRTLIKIYTFAPNFKFGTK